MRLCRSTKCAVLLAACFVAGCLSPQQPTGNTDAETAFIGEVSKGESFAHRIPGGLTFRLVPAAIGGWGIWVGDPERPGEDYSYVVTPPYRGVNSRDIFGWHFRNSDNTGPNEAGPKNVNAPGKTRGFNFVLNRDDYLTAWNALETLLRGDPNSEAFNRAEKRHRRLRKGSGELVIEDLDLGNLTVGERAWIEHMCFRVTTESIAARQSDPSGNTRVFEGAFRGGHDPTRRKRRTDRHPSTGLTVGQVLNEANERFAYNKRPIHPALVHEFQCWISDQNPVTVMLDVSAAFDTNEYCQAVTTRDLGITYETTEDDPKANPKEYYSYKHLGRLSEGTHVLKTARYGGGTGVFMSLLLVRFEIGRGYYQDGHPYDQLLMKLVRDFYLGDRFKGRIDVLPDRVNVGFPEGNTVTPNAKGNP